LRLSVQSFLDLLRTSRRRKRARQLCIPVDDGDLSWVIK
jgi:hypothetical protein